MAKKPIFTGISFPFTKGSYGIPERVIDEDLVKSDLVLLLNTRKGERAMLPNYGLDLERFIFDNTGGLLFAKIYREIVTCITNNEPRVEIVNIEIQENKNTVDIKLTYMVNGVMDSLTITRTKEDF